MIIYVNVIVYVEMLGTGSETLEISTGKSGSSHL